MYKCICGKEFLKSSQLGGHQSCCKEYLTSKGIFDVVMEARKQAAVKGALAVKSNKQKERQTSLISWIAEKHTCESCGKVMEEKYGSGRFCSKSCANKRAHSEETKAQIASSLTGKSGITLRLKNIEKYNEAPSKCHVCGKDLPYDYRDKQTCSDSCYKIYSSKAMKEKISLNGGNLNPNPGTAKSGKYKGIHCDSSWELAFLVYHLDHNIKIERNHKYFIYTYDNVESKYFPDFIVDDVIIEIKNYWSEQVQAKMESVPATMQYRILYEDDIEPYIDYCVHKYGKDFTTILYDK